VVDILGCIGHGYDIGGLLDTYVSVIIEPHFAGALPRSDEDNTVRSSHSINGTRGRVLQHLHRHDIRSVDIGDIARPDTVHDIQWIGPGQDRPCAPDNDLRRAARLATAGDLNTCQLALERLSGGEHRLFRQFGTIDVTYRTGYVYFPLGAISDYDDLVELIGSQPQLDIELPFMVDPDRLGNVTYIGDPKAAIRRRGDLKITAGVRGGAAAGPFDGDGNARQRLRGFPGNVTDDPDIHGVGVLRMDRRMKNTRDQQQKREHDRSEGCTNSSPLSTIFPIAGISYYLHQKWIVVIAANNIPAENAGRPETRGTRGDRRRGESEEPGDV